MTSVRDLADRFQRESFEHDPFAASSYGIPGYEDRVPDASEAGAAAWRAQVEAVLAEARSVDEQSLSEDDAVTLGCLVERGERELAELDTARPEFTVTPMPYLGPGHLLAIAARTVLPDEKAAADYLARLRLSGTWIDQQAERLRAGESNGRLPVAPLVEKAVSWAEAILAAPAPEAVLTPVPPTGWQGAEGWREERQQIAAEVIKPALGRWLETVRDLLGKARPGEKAGLSFLPGGEAEYGRAVRMHTTLPLSAEEIHERGLEQIERLEARATELGRDLGLSGLESVRQALRSAAGRDAPEEAMGKAREAVRRAEAVAGELFTDPLPAPCAVEAMPPVVAAAGAAPHYSPPRLDGARPGTYWFNTLLPTAGTGWDLEGVAFHETVPGHHLQLSRVQLLTELSELQRQGGFTVFNEGWALYAEQLSEEAALYKGSESLLGAVTNSLMRAGRLVVDTGLHAFGWSREKALSYFVEHVPMPPEFLATEIDRYIAWPGQALAYMTGQREILDVREEARRVLGSSFDLAGFHSAVLDHGSLPMPVLRRHVGRWVEQQRAPAGAAGGAAPGA